MNFFDIPATSNNASELVHTLANDFMVVFLSGVSTVAMTTLLLLMKRQLMLHQRPLANSCVPNKTN